MLQISNTHRHWLRFPLMWMMLLWPLALPGYEVRYRPTGAGLGECPVLRIWAASLLDKEQAL